MIPLVIPTIHPIDRVFHDSVDFRSFVGSDYNPSIGTGLTVVVRIRPELQLLGGNYVRLQFRGPSALSGVATTVTGVYINEAARASTRDPWDFTNTGTTQVTFNGLGSVTLNPKTSVMSDVVAFSFDASVINLVAFQITAGQLRRYTNQAGSQSVVSYSLSNALEAATVNKSTGYTAHADTSFALSRIRVAKSGDELDG